MSDLAYVVLSSQGLLGSGGSDQSFDALAVVPVREMVKASIKKRGEDSHLVEPSAELRARASRTPTLRFAVFDASLSHPLPGSSPELAAALRGSGEAIFINGAMDFRLRDDETSALLGQVWRVKDSGEWLIAIHGAKGEWPDLFYQARNTLTYEYPLIGPIFILTTIVISLAVYSGHAPLRRIATEAARIDIDSLDQRLPDENVPREIMPLIDALNGTLQRLDEGVARQKRFNANAAHELRTPIAMLFARLDNDDDLHLRGDLRRTLGQMRNIIDQLLVSARLNANTLPLGQEMDLADVVRSAVADYAPFAAENGRDIAFEAECAPAPVRGSRRAIESVVLNLLDNALRFEPEGGTIEVRVTAQPSIEVRDHGMGVEKSDRETVFEPFWRKSDVAPGFGLGLAIVKEIVERHGAKIWVEDAPDGGAVFKVSFSADLEKS